MVIKHLLLHHNIHDLLPKIIKLLPELTLGIAAVVDEIGHGIVLVGEPIHVSGKILPPFQPFIVVVFSLEQRH